MKAIYDTQADAGSIWLVDSGVSVDSGSRLDDIVFDYDADDRIIGIEILNASVHLPGEALEGVPESGGDTMEPMVLSVRHAIDSDFLDVRFADVARTAGKEVSPCVTARLAKARRRTSPPDRPSGSSCRADYVASAAHLCASVVPFPCCHVDQRRCGLRETEV